MQRNLRVFLDTSAILAGLNSPNGAAGVILAASFAKKVIPIISSQIIEETNRNVQLKFPKLTTAWQSFLLIPPEIIKDPTLKQIEKAHTILPTSDAPILACAIKIRPTALITWNTKDFMRKSILEAVDFPILIPGDFLHKFLL